MARRAARIDGNQVAIVQRLRELGATVQHLHMVGEGCPDLLIGARGITALAEIKTETGQLRDEQRLWIAEWRGADVYVLRSPEEAQMMIEEICA